MIMRRANKRSVRASARLIAMPYLIALTVVALTVAPTALSPTADAGSDDFDFAQKLAAKGRALGDSGWFDYARSIYERMIANSHDVDLAKYGLATLQREQALAGASRADTPYDEVKAMFAQAIGDIETFVEKNPKHPKAQLAKFDVGTTRLAFVQWARDMLGDPDRMGNRGTDAETLQADAQDMVQKAIRYFDELDDKWDVDAQTEKEFKEVEFAQLARYYWVVCRYYSALVLTPCSTQATDALTAAGNDLDEFIGFFDGTPVATYAQDFYGLTFWELARCESEEDKQVTLYRDAVGWFEACIETEHVDLDTLRIIARGYNHIAQCCLDAGRIGGENFLKQGATFLRKMLSKVPTVSATDDGIKAMIEWARIEAELDNADRAITILSEAGKKADDTGRPWLARKANAEIGIILSRGGGGPLGAAGKPDVLKRVADNQFAQKNYAAAIGAYQKVISACSDSLDDLLNYAIPAWERIAHAYHELGDPMAAALATEPIHNAWIDGRIPRKAGDPEDPNLLRMGKIRLKAQAELKALFDMTGSPLHGKMWRRNSDSFKTDYPDHPSGRLGEAKKASRLYNEARTLKKKKDSAWRNKLKEAVAVFEQIAKDPDNPAQHSALVRLIRTEKTKDDFKGMVRRADEAFAYWAGPECQKLMKEHSSIADRVKSSRGLATYWKAVGLLGLEANDDVIELLKDFGVKHGGVKDQFMKADVLGMLVISHVKKQEIDQADGYLRRLLQTYPKYVRLPAITFELAKFYEAQYSEIEARYKTALTAKYATPGNRKDGLVYKLRQAEKDENYVAERLVDIVGDRSQNQRLIDKWAAAKIQAKEENRKVEDVLKGATQKAVDVAAAKIKGQKEPPEGEDDKWPKKYQIGLDKTIAENNQRLKELRALREDLEGRLITENKNIEIYKTEMYPPLAKAASYYYDWLQVLIANGEKPTAKNLQIFGYRFYYATILNPDDKDAWLKAKEIYEMYAAMPGITDAERTDVAAKLGRIYSHLSEVSTDEKEKRDYVLKAVDLLQAAVAKNPDNTNLIVGLLTGDYVVIPYRSPLDFQNYRIPIRRVKDVADFRNAVSQLGGEASPLPKFKSQRKQTGFDNAISEFKKMIKKKSDKELQRTAKGFKTAGFDSTFYRAHGNTNADFRSALARVYAQSGRPDDARKAISLTHTLLNSRALGVEENSDAYWEAQVIKFAAYAKAAEVGLAGANTKADAKAMLELAGKSITALYSQNPSLGKNVRPQTAQELRDILQRLNLLRQKSGLSPLRLDLQAKDIVDDSDPKAAGGSAEDDAEKKRGE